MPAPTVSDRRIAAAPLGDLREQAAGGNRRCAHTRLAQLLAALVPEPDPAIEPSALGSDGTWVMVVIQRGDAHLTYRWWVRPPAGWGARGGRRVVQQLADAPGAQAALREQQIARQLFQRLAARDLVRMLELYHPFRRWS